MGSLRVLIVDDEEVILRVMAASLRLEGCEVFSAHSATEARQILMSQTLSAVITDYRMPGESGRALLGFIRRSFPEVPTIVLTGVDDSELARDLIREGADDFLAKPFRRGELIRVLGQVLARRERDAAWAQGWQDGVLSETINALAAAVEAKDPYTANHSARVACFARELGGDAGLTAAELTILDHAARVHDLGKIGVPEATLNKKGALTHEDWEAIKRHPTLSAEIVGRVGLLHQVARVVRHHHERMDGHGYPVGLQGEAIPLMSRILAIADAYDALTSDRAYRRSFDARSALAILESDAGKQFDPTLVQQFVHRVRLKLSDEAGND